VVIALFGAELDSGRLERARAEIGERRKKHAPQRGRDAHGTRIFGRADGC
jgi:hypothetical protein